MCWQVNVAERSPCSAQLTIRMLSLRLWPNGMELTGGPRRRAQPPHAGRPC
jgi:hypothetical protein